MLQIDFIVTNNSIVEVGNIECSVWPRDQIYWPKPRVGRAQKVWLFDSSNTGTRSFQVVPIDSRRHHVAIESTFCKLRRETQMGTQSQCCNSGGTMQMFHHVGDVTEAVVRPAKAVITSAGQQQRDRLGVTVGGENVTELIDRHPEWIDLPLSIKLNA